MRLAIHVQTDVTTRRHRRNHRIRNRLPTNKVQIARIRPSPTRIHRHEPATHQRILTLNRRHIQRNRSNTPRRHPRPARTPSTSAPHQTHPTHQPCPHHGYPTSSPASPPRTQSRSEGSRTRRPADAPCHTRTNRCHHPTTPAQSPHSESSAHQQSSNCSHPAESHTDTPSRTRHPPTDSHPQPPSHSTQPQQHPPTAPPTSTDHPQRLRRTRPIQRTNLAPTTAIQNPRRRHRREPRPDRKVAGHVDQQMRLAIHVQTDVTTRRHRRNHRIRNRLPTNKVQIARIRPSPTRIHRHEPATHQRVLTLNRRHIQRNRSNTPRRHPALDRTPSTSAPHQTHPTHQPCPHHDVSNILAGVTGTNDCPAASTSPPGAATRTKPCRSTTGRPARRSRPTAGLGPHLSSSSTGGSSRLSPSCSELRALLSSGSASGRHYGPQATIQGRTRRAVVLRTEHFAA